VAFWRIFRLESIRMVRQPLRLVFFVGVLPAGAWLPDRIPDQGLRGFLLHILVHATTLFILLAIMAMPPLKVGEAEQDVTLGRNDESASTQRSVTHRADPDS